jgi:hypothetical protein
MWFCGITRLGRLGCEIGFHALNPFGICCNCMGEKSAYRASSGYEEQCNTQICRHTPFRVLVGAGGGEGLSTTVHTLGAWPLWSAYLIPEQQLRNDALFGINMRADIQDA